MDEAQGQTLISDQSARLVEEELVELENPLSSDMTVLRPSLMPGLLDSLKNNLVHQSQNVALFEVGRTFAPRSKEIRKVAILITGRRYPAFWGDDRAKQDINDLKGVVDQMLELLGVYGVNFNRREEATTLYIESADIKMGKQSIGQMGQLQPGVGKRFEAREAVYIAELDLDKLLQRRNSSKSFKGLPQFPASERDVAMLVDESVTHSDVLEVVNKVKPDNLVTARLFDVFRGKNVPEGQKSLAYCFTYRSNDRTLKEKEINSAHDVLVKAFKDLLSATVRDT